MICCKSYYLIWHDVPQIYVLSECAKHCSLCYNETECYECTQGFYLDGSGECERKKLVIKE